MTDLITGDSIKETEAYKKLDGFQKLMIVKRDNRAILENAFIHHKATGQMLPQIGASNTKVLTEIIAKNEQHQSASD